jgi:hypothetical protein
MLGARLAALPLPSGELIDMDYVVLLMAGAAVLALVLGL